MGIQLVHSRKTLNSVLKHILMTKKSYAIFILAKFLCCLFCGGNEKPIYPFHDSSRVTHLLDVLKPKTLSSMSSTLVLYPGFLPEASALEPGFSGPWCFSLALLSLPLQSYLPSRHQKWELYFNFLDDFLTGHILLRWLLLIIVFSQQQLIRVKPTKERELAAVLCLKSKET